MSATTFYLTRYKRPDGSHIIHAHNIDTTSYTMCGLFTSITTLQPIEQIPIEERTMEDLIQFYKDNRGIPWFRIEESLGDILYEWLGRKDIHICQSCLSAIRKTVKERYQNLVSRGKVAVENDLPADLTLATATPDAKTLHITVLPNFDESHKISDMVLNAKWFGGNHNLLQRQASLCYCSPYTYPSANACRHGVRFSTTDLRGWERVDRSISRKCIDELEVLIREIALNKLETKRICRNCLKALACILRDNYPQPKKEKTKIDHQEETKEVNTKMDTDSYTAVDVPRVGLPDDAIFGAIVFPMQDKGLHYTEDIIPYFLNRNPWQGGFITMGRTPEEAIQQLLDGKDSDEEREEMVQALREGRVRIFELTSREYTFSIKETKKYTVEATRVFA